MDTIEQKCKDIIREFSIGKGNDGDFYWIYSVGMGSFSYSPIAEIYLPTISSLVESNTLVETGEYVNLPVYTKDKVLTVTFTLWELKEKE